MNSKKILPLLALLFLMMSGGSAYAQSSPSPTPNSQTPANGSSSQSAADLQDIETLQDQLKQRDAELAAKDKTIAEHIAKDIVQVQLIQTLQERGDFFKDEADKRQTIDVNQIRIDQVCGEQKAMLRDEVERLREEANGLRKSRDRWRLVGVFSLSANAAQARGALPR